MAGFWLAGQGTAGARKRGGIQHFQYGKSATQSQPTKVCSYGFLQLFNTVHTEPEGSAKLAAIADITATTDSTLHLPCVRFLHQQKLLQFVLQCLTPALLTGAHLLAFAYVLRTMPLPALRINMTRIVPLLFRGLELENAVAVEIFIDVVDRLMEAKCETIVEHLNRVIPLYVRLCSFRGSMVSTILFGSKQAKRIVSYNTCVPITENPLCSPERSTAHLQTVSGDRTSAVQTGRAVRSGRSARRPEAACATGRR